MGVCFCRDAGHGMTDMRDCPRHLEEFYGSRECPTDHMWKEQSFDVWHKHKTPFCPDCGTRLIPF